MGSAGGFAESLVVIDQDRWRTAGRSGVAAHGPAGAARGRGCAAGAGRRRRGRIVRRLSDLHRRGDGGTICQSARVDSQLSSGAASNRLPVSDKKMTVSFLLKRFVQGAELGGMTRHELWMSNIPPQILARLGIPPASPRADDHGDGLLLDRVQRWDLESFLAEGLLTKADRASMTSALDPRRRFENGAGLDLARELVAARPATQTIVVCRQPTLQSARRGSHPHTRLHRQTLRPGWDQRTGPARLGTL